MVFTGKALHTYIGELNGTFWFGTKRFESSRLDASITRLSLTKTGYFIFPIQMMRLRLRCSEENSVNGRLVRFPLMPLEYPRSILLHGQVQGKIIRMSDCVPRFV